MSGLSWLKKLFKRQPSQKAIILGADYPEYRLALELAEEGIYRVLYFIDESPWDHRGKLCDGELRYPSELSALCSNNTIDAVFYCDDEWLPKVSDSGVSVTKRSAIELFE